MPDPVPIDVNWYPIESDLEDAERFRRELCHVG
jgi:hypothetical protein